MSSRRSIVPYLILGLTLLGAVLRLWELGSQSLWLDEVFTARVAPLDLAGILSAIRMDLDTPPLHPFVVHAFLALGDSEFVLRLPSAFASILCVPLVYVVARRMLGWQTGLLAAALMACSPYAVYYAQEARMYGLVLMFSMLILYCLLQAMGCEQAEVSPRRHGEIAYERPQTSEVSENFGSLNGAILQPGHGETAQELRAPSVSVVSDPVHGSSRIAWAGFVLSSALGLYTHFFCFFVVGLAVLYAAMRVAIDWRAGQRVAALAHSRSLLLSLAAIALLYLPWLPVLLSFFGENYAENPYGQSWQANLGLPTALNMFTLMLGGYWAPLAVRWATRLLLLAGLLVMARRRPVAAVLTVLTATLPFVVISVLNPGHFVTERYFIFMLPLLIIGMAEAMRALAGLGAAMLQRVRILQPRPSLVVGLPLLAVLLLLPPLCVPGLQSYFTEPPKPAWRSLAHYVAGTVPPGDLIIVAMFPHWDKEPLQHYLKMGGRRVIYAAEANNLRQILAEEDSRPWWIVYAGSERRLGIMMSRGVGANFTVIPFNYLAVVRRNGESVAALDDAVTILKTLVPRIPGPYQGEVQRVIRYLSTPDADSGQPLPPPVPTTAK